MPNLHGFAAVAVFFFFFIVTVATVKDAPVPGWHKPAVIFSVCACAPCPRRCVFVWCVVVWRHHLPLSKSRRIHVGGWWHCGGDLPHLHRDRLQAPQRRPQEADAAGLRGRQCVEEEPAGRALSASFSNHTPLHLHLLPPGGGALSQDRSNMGPLFYAFFLSLFLRVRVFFLESCRSLQLLLAGPVWKVFNKSTRGHSQLCGHGCCVLVAYQIVAAVKPEAAPELGSSPVQSRSWPKLEPFLLSVSTGQGTFWKSSCGCSCNTIFST